MNGDWSSFKNSALRYQTQHKAIKFWNVLKFIKDKDGIIFTKKIEEHYNCFGWYNALDYCQVQELSAIMNKVFYHTNLDDYL